MDINIDSQIVVQTEAQWGADTDVYSEKRILVTSDVYYTGTDQRKFKLANGVHTWANLDYMPLGGSTTWGGITGTLSNQTDLQNALNAKENSITAGTTAQYWRGDKTFQTLDKTAVGLGNVDNTSDANKPISTATQTALDGKVDENAAITGATKTKITYDSKGLVTAGEDATTADISASTDKNYVTDAQLVVIGNTSGTNSGNETVNTLGATINGAASATPNDTDLVASVESSVVKKNTWTQVKAFLKTYFDTLYVSLTGSYANPSWLTALAWSKITGTPTTLSGYGITDAALKNYSYTGQFLAVNPADATNYHFNGNSIAPSSTDSARAFKFAKAGTIDRVYLAYQQTTNGSNETITLYLRNVTAGTDASVGTFTSDFGGSTGSGFNFEGLSLSVNSTDFYTWKITTPTWSTNPAAWIGNLISRLLY